MTPNYSLRPPSQQRRAMAMTLCSRRWSAWHTMMLSCLLLLSLSTAAHAAIEFDLRLDPGVAAPGEQVMVEFTISNNGTLPEAGLTVELEYPAGVASLSEQAISGPFNAGASCAIGQFNGNICETGEPMIWSIAGLNPGEARVSRFPVVIAGGTASGTSINWAADVSDSGGIIVSDSATLDVDAGTVATLSIDTDKDPVSAGDTLNYRIHYGNRSTSNLTSGLLSLTLPADTSFVSASAGGSFAAGEVTWNLGALAADSVGEQTVQVSVNASPNGTLLPATATLNAIVNGLPTTARTADTAYVGGGSPLRLSVDVNPLPARPGEQVMVALKIANTSNLPVLGAQIQLRYPQHLSTVSEQVILGEDAGASCFFGQFNADICSTNEFLFFNIAALNPGRAKEFTLPVTVAGGAGDLVRWEARVDDGSGNESWESVTLPVDASTVLSLAIDQDKDPVAAGETLTYVVNYANRSTGNVSGGELALALPPNTTFVSASSGGTLVDSEVRWTLGTIPASTVRRQLVEVSVAPSVPNGTLLPARARINGLSSSLPTKQQAAITAPVGVGGPLGLALDFSASPAAPGERVTVSAKLGNTGNLPVIGSQVLLRFPRRVNTLLEAFILGEDDASSCNVGQFNGAECSTNEYVIFNVDALSPGRAQEFRLPITLAAGASTGDLIRFDARIIDGDGNESWEKHTLPVDTMGVLGLSIDQDKDPVAPGDTLTYSVFYSNTSSANVTDVTLTIDLPPDTTLVSASNGGVATGNQVQWTLGTLPGEATGEQTVEIMVSDTSSAGSLLNVSGRFRGTASSLPTEQRTTTSAYVGAQSPLELSLDFKASPAQSGQQVLVSLKLGNTSNLPILGAQLLLPFPARLDSLLEAVILGEDASASCFVGQFNPELCSTNEYVIFNVAALNPGRALEFTLPVTIASGADTGDFVDFDVRVLDGEGLETWHKRTLPVQNGAALNLAVDQANDPVAPGASQTWLVRYANTTASNITEAELSLALPDNVTFVSATGGGIISGNRVVWPLGTLPGASLGQRAVSATVSPDPMAGSVQSVTANLTGTRNSLPTSRRAEDSAYLNGPGPLAFELTVNPQPGSAGAALDVAMSIVNTGETPVIGAQVVMQYPPGISSINESVIEGGLDAGASCAIGSFNQSTCSTNEFMIWNFDPINPGETLELALPPSVGGGVATGTLIDWSARLRGESGADTWQTITLPIGNDSAGDVDGDGISDSFDNCVIDANADQTDTDGDGYGNRCDADFNNDCVINVVDLGLIRQTFFGSDANTDLNGDGVVNVIDLGILRGLFFAPPGPSANSAVCN